MSRTILAVDDSASAQQLVKMTLTGAGYTVTVATNGAQGLDKAKAGSFDLVLTDLNMPVMNGIEMIREIRKLPNGKGMPIIFLTTETDAGKKAEAKAAGATAWLTKPFQQDQLIKLVKQMLGA